MVISNQKMEICSIYCSSVLSSSSTSSTPCSSVTRLTVPIYHVLVPFHHGLPQNEVTMDWHEQLFPQLVVPICSCVCCVSILRCSTYARLKRIACRNACLTRIWSQLYRVFDLRNDQLLWGRSALCSHEKNCLQKRLLSQWILLYSSFVLYTHRERERHTHTYKKQLACCAWRQACTHSGIRVVYI